ncbi:hypothetical protein [Psychroserpens luteus]|uniref:Uncharacterized protein n=1 Tax=Psychroserpens luteus TaxID=1434066 RepID=A0ABW5ZNS8_9FLAO|nr:hypothetical protein [Psychroserpens luteus]
MRKKIIYYLAFSLISMVSYGQEVFSTIGVDDLVTLEYEIYPSLNAIELEKKSVVIDFTTLFDKPTIGFGARYTSHSMGFEDYNMHNMFTSFEELHHVSVYAKYRKALANNWNLDATIAPYLASTFNEGITREDFVLSYSAHFIKNWDNDGLKSSLKLGGGYGSLFGKPNFYPLISYSKAVNKKFRYEIGFPITGAYYKINEQSQIDITAQPESIYANNPSGFNIVNESLIDNSKLQFSALKLSIVYTYLFDDNWSSSFSVGYLAASELTIEDSNSNSNNIYDFDSNESVSLNIGISFNINNK